MQRVRKLKNLKKKTTYIRSQRNQHVNEKLMRRQIHFFYLHLLLCIMKNVSQSSPGYSPNSSTPSRSIKILILADS